MCINIENDLIIQCSCCNSINIIDSDSLNEETCSYERPMGDEIEHSFTGECQCTECGNSIKYLIKVFEYPVGAVNYKKLECDGGKFEEELVININYQDEEFQNSFGDNPFLFTLVNKCNERFKRSKCWTCKYKKHCPHDCGHCLNYIHSPNAAPLPRKYDCVRMCDYYVCKYSYKYTSEIYYALNCMVNLKSKKRLKVLSIGCGPCTDLLALNILKNMGTYSFDELEYKGIEIDTKIWKKVHKDISLFVSSGYKFEIINEDACAYIDTLLKNEWKPDLIVFQYVFSDMQKHTCVDHVMHFLDSMAKYIQACDNNTYIVCNDINLSRKYMGGREFFDMLNQRINCDKIVHKRHFNNINKKSHFEYGDEYPNNDLILKLPNALKDYQPFNSCASAQIIIKKVMK